MYFFVYFLRGLSLYLHKINVMMSKYFTSLLLVFCLSQVLYSQEYHHSEKKILDHLTTPTINKGRIRIYQDSRLDSLMSKHKIEAQSNLEITENVAYVVGRGYRIQIFSGNNQRESKNQAYAMEQEIKERMPKLDTYVTFNQPFWKLRVGNFRTYEEAQAMLRNIKKEFPGWKEMFISNDVVKYPIRRY